MISPVLVYYLLFHYAPMYGAVIAFKDFDVGLGIGGSPWVGFFHFKQFLNSFFFWRLMRNTLLISLYQLFFGFPVPIILAILLNEIRWPLFKRITQTTSYLPYFVSLVVICGMIRDFVSARGIITWLLSHLGAEKINYLAFPQYFRTIYVASYIWQTAGYGTIIYLAALSGVDAQLYEAAQIDGAGRFAKIFHVTLPSIFPTIVTLFVLRVGQIMNVSFEKVILLYNPNTYETADLISTYVYRKGLGGNFEFSYMTAIGLFSSVLNLILLTTANSVTRKLGSESLW
jgi:putative aldouronate transport system permease protein